MIDEITRIIQEAYADAEIEPESDAFLSWRKKMKEVQRILARRVLRLRRFNDQLQRTLMDCMIENRELKDKLKRRNR